VATCGSLRTITASLVASLDLLPVAAPKSSSSTTLHSLSSKQGRRHLDTSTPETLSGSGSSSSYARLPHGRARNVRLETVMAASRCTEAQVRLGFAQA
jgi:hypothetical protein